MIRHKEQYFLKQFGLIFIISGGVGNLIDRIFNNGTVIDFIRLRLPLIESGIFNIADFYVTFGFIFLLMAMFKREKINVTN
ncbi:MAG: signal peptidase II [Ignavibacteriales bacterium]|nr:signal peptidase II [Ignavibacteriales bacterium]